LYCGGTSASCTAPGSIWSDWYHALFEGEKLKSHIVVSFNVFFKAIWVVGCNKLLNPAKFLQKP
jgi:hypothetical protein